MRHGGFDAIVSNPPFIGGKKVSGALGTDYREYLKQRHRQRTSQATLTCAPTSCSAISRSRRDGRVGIIATNTIAQGDTREVGLDQAVDMGWAVYRAEKSQPWPGTASLEVSLLWTGHPGSTRSASSTAVESTGITPSLDPQSRMSRQSIPAGRECRPSPSRARMSWGLASSWSQRRRRHLITKDPRNKAVLFPYLNGEDLNSRWDCSASRWVINFHDWPIETSDGSTQTSSQSSTRKYGLSAAHEARWKLRTSQGCRSAGGSTLTSARTYAQAIADLDRVLVIARTSRTGSCPSFVPARSSLCT